MVLLKIQYLNVKNLKKPFCGGEIPLNPPFDGPMGLVFELERVFTTLHVCTKFHKDRIIFTADIVLTDIYIYI